MSEMPSIDDGPITLERGIDIVNKYYVLTIIEYLDKKTMV
jgi:hypothetical protein